MTGNSSKFFRKILKTGLITASGAAIMLSSSGALGAAAARTTTAPGVNFGTGVGLDGGGVFVAGSTLQFGGVHDVASANVNILAVDMNNNTTTAFVANHLSIGSIVDTSVPAGGKISVSLNARTLTLTGKGTNLAGFPTFVAADNIYTALDSITFNGDPAGVVTVQSYNNAATTLSGNIISKIAGFGTLNLNTDTQIDGTIGATNLLATISIGASTATLGGAVIKATTTNLTNDASVLTFTNPVTVTGNIDNTGNVNNGVVNFNGAGNSSVSGKIGNTAALAAVNFKGAGAVAITGTSNATTFTVGNAGADVTATGLMTGKVAFTAGGTLTPNGGIAGDVNVSNGGKIAGGKDVTGDLVLSDGAGAVDVGAVAGAEVEVNAGGPLTIKSANNGIKFTGTAIAGTTINVVDNAASNVGNVNNDAVNGAGTGILNFLGAGTAGTIGANNSLAAVNFKGAGAVAITGTSNATTFTVGNAGADVTATGLMTGKVAFTAGGQLTLGNGITDTVTTAANNEGTVIVTTGDIQAVGVGGKSIKKVTFNNVAASNAGNIFATDVTVGNAGTDVTTGTVNGAIDFTAAGKLNAGALVTGTAVLTTDGQLTLGNGITGDITSAGNNGTVIVTAGNVANVGTAGSLLKQVTFNNVGASNAGNIFATDVTVGNAGTDVTTDTVNGAIDFTAAGKLNAGALVTGTAVFNADGQLTLGNGITGAVTTAANNTGKLIVTAGDVGGAIGTNAGNILNSVTFNGASNVKTIDATTVAIGAGGDVKTTEAVTADVNFTGDGQLTVGAGGITGAVTTAVNDEGTLIVTAGDVAAVGVGASLKQITFNGVSILNGAIDAKTITINGAVTAKVGAITGNVNITSGTLTTNQVITGDLAVSNGGNLAGDAATTNVTGTVTLQPGATGIVTIRDALNAAAVSVGAGTLNLKNANGINFDIGAGAGTTVTVAAGGNVNNVQNMTGFDNIGILTFKGAGQAGIIGNANSLSEVNVGAGEVTIKGAVVKANAINLTTIGIVPGAASVILFADTAQVTGAILNTSGTDKRGIAIFQASAGDSSITGGVGLNGAALAGLFTKVDAGKVITLTGNVYTEKLVLDDTAGGNAVGTVEIVGNLTGDVTFGTDANGAGGTLEFNGNAPNTVYDFKGAIAANPNNGTLNVNTDKLIAYDASVGTLKQIDIQDTKTLQIDASAGDVTILGVGKAINFVGANSNLGFSNLTGAGAKNIKFAGNLPAVAAGGGGKLAFIGGVAQGDILNVTSSAAAVRNIGDAAGNKFTSLTVSGYVATKDLDLAGINQLDIAAGANFIDNSGTSPNIGVVNIGAAVPTLGIPAAGAATYTIDAGGVNVPILTPGKQINFADADAELVLQNSSAVADGTITLLATLDPGAVNTGKLTIDSGSNGKKITLANAGGATYGTNVNKLKEFAFAGNGTFKIDTVIYAGDLELLVPAIEYGVDINSNLSFGVNTQLSQGGNINGNIDFKNQAAVITLDNGKNITGSVTSSNGVNGTIIALGASTINGPITNLAMLKVGAGAVSITTGGDNSITEIQGTGTDTLTLPENFKLTGAINSTSGLAVKLNFKGGTNSISGIVGTQTNPVGGITTAGTTTFTSAVNSKGPITTVGNTTFSNSLNNIGDVTTSGTTIFTGAYTNTGTAKFGGTTNFASTFNNTGAVTTSGTTTYTGAYTNKGTATFGGTTSFADTFNNTGAVTLAPGSINNFAKNVTATSFVASGATMNFSNSLAFNSSLTGSGTTINLGSGQLAYTGEGSFSDKLIIATTYEQAIPGGGNILIKAGSKLDLSQVNDLEIQFTAPGLTIDQINKNTKYQLIVAEASGGLVPTSANINFIVNGQEFTNAFVKWSIDTSSLTLSAKDVAEETIDEEFGPGGELENIPNATELEIAFREMENAPNGADAREALNNLGILTPIQRAEAGTHLLQNDTRPGVEASNITTQVVTSNITSNLVSVSARMDKISTGNQTQVKSPVSAGEEDDTSFGVWGSPFVGNSTQKMRNNVNGYKSTSNGGTVGFDALLNDDLVLGVAYTKANTKIKLKDTKVGDKTKVNSNIYSLYGLYNLPNNNWFFSAIASYGDSKMKSYSKRIVAVAPNTPGFQTTIGKYTSKSYTGQVMAGYNYLAPQDINLIPMVGLRYSNIKDKGYKETGATFQNLIVKGKNYNIVEGLAGAKVSTNVNVDQVILTPELYGLINYGFKNKAPAIDARLQGMDAPFPTNSFKSPKVSYNLGAGVTAKYQMMEYGVNYDVNIASKYFAQQGSLKVRVNF